MTSPTDQFFLTWGALAAQDGARDARRANQRSNNLQQEVDNLSQELQQAYQDYRNTREAHDILHKTVVWYEGAYADIKQQLAAREEERTKIYQEIGLIKGDVKLAEGKAFLFWTRELTQNAFVDAFQNTSEKMTKALQEVAKKHQNNDDLQQLAQSWTFQKYMETAIAEGRALTKKRVENGVRADVKSGKILPFVDYPPPKIDKERYDQQS